MTTPSPDKLAIPEAAVEALPCPFCGTRPDVMEWMSGHSDARVFCSNADCNAWGPDANSENKTWNDASTHEHLAAISRSEAIAAWNRRLPHIPDRGYAEVGVKQLVWTAYPNAFYPDVYGNCWDAETPFGRYQIEERSASDSGSYYVNFGVERRFVADKDGLPEAQAAAQQDFEDRVKSVRVPPANPGDAGRKSWRCFHCDEMFIDEHCARMHFGADETSTPACQIKGAELGLVEALRRAENDASEAWSAIHNETTDSAKAYYAQSARHQEQLRVVEQAGYDRGIADAKSHPETLGLPATPSPIEDVAEPSEALPPATPSQAAVGWTLDVDYLDKVRAEMLEATGYDATIECVEFCLLLAARRVRPSPVDEARDGVLEEAAKVAERLTEVIPMWDRPGGPPGNGPKRPGSPAEIARAIRALQSQRKG